MRLPYDHSNSAMTTPMTTPIKRCNKKHYNFILLSLLIGFGLAGVAHAAPITVPNFSFETPVQGDGGSAGLPVSGWNVAFSDTLGGSRVINPAEAAFTGAGGSPGTLPATAHGVQALFYDDTANSQDRKSVV